VTLATEQKAGGQRRSQDCAGRCGAGGLAWAVAHSAACTAQAKRTTGRAGGAPTNWRRGAARRREAPTTTDLLLDRAADESCRRVAPDGDDLE
jgi:hypothetical protein